MQPKWTTLIALTACVPGTAAAAQAKRAGLTDREVLND